MAAKGITPKQIKKWTAGGRSYEECKPGRCLLWVISGLRHPSFDVRFTPNSGHQAVGLRCPLCANRRHYSIMWSAATSIDCGTAMPSARAVTALMVSSNLSNCTTGRSAGFAPLRMRPA